MNVCLLGTERARLKKFVEFLEVDLFHFTRKSSPGCDPSDDCNQKKLVVLNDICVLAKKFLLACWVFEGYSHVWLV